MLANDLAIRDAARVGTNQYEEILVRGVAGREAERRGAAPRAAGPVQVRDAHLRLAVHACGEREQQGGSRPPVGPGPPRFIGMLFGHGVLRAAEVRE